MSADLTAAGRVCPQCGSHAGPGEMFCEECGYDFAPDATPAVPARPEVAGLGAVGRAQAGPGEEIGGVDADSVRFDAAAVPAGPPRRVGVEVKDADLESPPGPCVACGGTIAGDGYCEQCGAAAPRPRDHWVERPATWVALACDRGVRHAINQDGAAVGASEQPGGFAAMVVCDGVSSAARSEVASLAAARAARDVLVAPRPEPGTANPLPVAPVLPVPGAPSQDTVPVRIVGPAEPDPPPVAASEPVAEAPVEPVAEAPVEPVAEDPDRPQPAHPVEEPGQEQPVGSSATPSRASLLTAAMREAGEAAQEQAVAAASDPPEYNPPACTFAAAVIDGSVLVAGWVGDSRVYWLPDDGPPQQLSEDDSLAGEAIRQGLPREDAERSPHAHSITRWLGHDAPDPQPRTAVRRIERPAWVLVCSDGLWNYCSEATAMRDLVAHAAGGVGQDVGATAEALVTWTIEQGGHDNIAVVLARVG